MCPNEQVFSLHIHLLSHLTSNHQVRINESVLYLRNLEFTAWKALENRQVNYACDVKKKHSNGEEDILYNCNRSDSRRFVSLCKKRCMKTGGSIRIRGICPSRIKVKISKDVIEIIIGNVMVKFTETHVGHDDELCNKRLLKDDKNLIVGQLTAGVTNNKIMQHARNISGLSTSKLHIQNNVTHFTQKNSNRQDQERSLSFKEMREIGIAEMSNFSRSLDENEFENLMAVFAKFKNGITEKREQERILKKIKIEKQT